MGLDLRLGEIERRMNSAGRLIARLSAEIAAVKQTADRLNYAPPPPVTEAVGDLVKRARVTTAIPTGTLASPSSTGKVKLQEKAPNGSWSDGDEVPCLNDFTMPASLPVGRVVKVAKIAGAWWLVSASCS